MGKRKASSGITPQSIAAEKKLARMENTAPYAGRAITENDYQVISKELSSRILYPNPVCFLTTEDEKGKHNVMTISWLTAANNAGGLVCVINKARFSANALMATKKFTLSVATEQHKEALVSIGKVSGRSVSKLDTISGLKLGKAWDGGSNASASSSKKGAGGVFANFNDDSSDDEEKEVEEEGKPKSDADSSNGTPGYPAPIKGTAAQLCCHVLTIGDAADPSHHLVVAQVMYARVANRYFDGKLFVSRKLEGEPAPPPYLSFLGSQTFGSMVPDASKVVLKKGKEDVEEEEEDVEEK
jgi:flavin reductase (DIM6/NTAB) family NADH-FMN oxidoreductase RutF